MGGALLTPVQWRRCVIDELAGMVSIARRGVWDYAEWPYTD